MGGPSDAFRLIETGGDPRQFPKHVKQDGVLSLTQARIARKQE